MASGPVRIGILGCARIARSALLLPAGEVPEIVVSAVASRDAARAAAFAQAHGLARSHGSYEALLADPDIEVIYNPLPNSLHAEWSIKALAAGKAVLCEKPLASNAHEAQRIVDAARETGQTLIEAFHYRYHPVARFIVETVRSGALGPLRRVAAGLNVPGKLLADDDIRFQLPLAGGSTMDLGAYCINALRLAVGEEPQVQAAAATLASPGVDGSMSARLRFPSGVEGAFECSLRAEALGAWLRIVGERGELHADNPYLPQLGHSVSLTIDGETSVQKFERTATYVFQARHVADVVRRGVAVQTTGEDGVANMAVVDAVYAAAGLEPRGARQAAA